MTSTAKQDQLLFRFRQTDTLTGVSRSTTRKMAESLGFTGEAQVIHYALQRLAKEVLPSYEADDGELTDSQLMAIRTAVPQDPTKTIKASLF